MPDDSELLRGIRSGDPASFRALVDREGRYLFGIAHGLAGNAADAEDLVQETFMALAGGSFEGRSSVRTWLVSVLVRRAAMHRRRERRRDGQVSLDAAEPVGAPPSGSEARLDLSQMLACLSLEHRAVIVLRELQGMSYEEMAKVLGVPRGTIESRLHRAREALRQRFRGYLQSG